MHKWAHLEPALLWSLICPVNGKPPCGLGPLLCPPKLAGPYPPNRASLLIMRERHKDLLVVSTPHIYAFFDFRLISDQATAATTRTTTIISPIIPQLTPGATGEAGGGADE